MWIRNAVSIWQFDYEIFKKGNKLLFMHVQLLTFSFFSSYTVYPYTLYVLFILLRALNYRHNVQLFVKHTFVRTISPLVIFFFMVFVFYESVLSLVHFSCLESCCLRPFNFYYDVFDDWLLSCLILLSRHNLKVELKDVPIVCIPTSEEESILFVLDHNSQI